LHHGIAHTLDHQQSGRGGRDHPVEIAERLKKQPGQGLHILPRDGAEQDEFQQFIIRQGGSPPLHEAGAQAFAVVGDIAGQLARQGRGLYLVRIARHVEQQPPGIIEAMVCHGFNFASYGEERVNSPSCRPRNP
jgi:hypothetical protein